MMKKIIFGILACLPCLCPWVGYAQDNGTSGTDYTRQVNVFIGTGSTDSLSLSGSNFPGACYPFGMVQLSPDTRVRPNDPCSGYDYSDKTIVGFSHTHLSGTGVPDLFDFLFMPSGGEIKWVPGEEADGQHGYRSSFKHSSEVAYPGYYSVVLDDYGIKAEMTAKAHSGMQKYTFPNNQPYHVILDLSHCRGRDCRIIGAQLRVVDNKTIEGYRILTGWARVRKIYFRAEFSRPFSSAILRNGQNEYPNAPIVNGTNVKMAVNFDENTEPLLVRVGVSSVNQDGARENLAAEMADFDFDHIVKETNTAWNKELSCLDVDGTEAQKHIVYTGLYHLFIQPNNIADVNGNYTDVNMQERKAPDGEFYSTFSLWDTYRAAHPLYTLIQPVRAAKFINSMLRQYDDYGYLPIWQLWGEETYCMIGNHAIPPIVDAYVKNLPGVDYKHAYEAIKGSSTTPHYNSPFNILDQYGYYPEDLQTQSVSIQLEGAYDDWCVAEMAKKEGKEEDFTYFNKRAGDYRNLFDSEIGFFRAKNSRGEWINPFEPLNYGGNGGYPFTEGNAWQYLWYVPQDVPNLISLLGGKEKFIQKLDTFFTLKAKPSDVNGNASGFIGQYAHGNEPSHHITYLYDFAGQPWKTQYYASKIMKEQYTMSPSGYSGNEDCGQMSSWYIFSAMGFYPVNPANGIYCIGSPQLAKAEIKLANGKTFRVITHNAGGANSYILNAKMNGLTYNKSYITYKDIINGGTLEFYMGSKPNKKWGRISPPSMM